MGTHTAGETPMTRTSRSLRLSVLRLSVLRLSVLRLSVLRLSVLRLSVNAVNLIALGVISAGVVSAGCGGPAVQAIRVTSPFTEEHETAFENGVDYIDDPSILEGSWLHSWEDDIDRRVSLADAVVFVTITTFREDVDLERRKTYRLVARVDRRRHGEVPDEIVLVVRQGEIGFGTVDENHGRLLNQRFVAFLKWVDDGGQVVARWHLSPAAERVVRRVNTLVERRHTPTEERRRVIVREHAAPSDDDEDFEEPAAEESTDAH
jgi:hypothetical protein